VDDKGRELIASLDPMGNKDAEEIIKMSGEQGLYWWENTLPQYQNAWENVLIPQLKKLGYDSIEYQDDVATGRTLAVFDITSLTMLESQGLGQGRTITIVSDKGKYDVSGMRAKGGKSDMSIPNPENRVGWAIRSSGPVTEVQECNTQRCYRQVQ